MSAPTVRLKAEALARLLDVAARHEVEGVCLTLIEHSKRGTWLSEQLHELGRQVGDRFTWPYLAELLATVDQLAFQLDDWPIPVVKLDLERLPLTDLYAAAQLRRSECRVIERKALGALVQRLSETLEQGRVGRGEGGASTDAPGKGE